MDEGIEALHVDLFEDKLAVVPLVDVLHLLVGQGDGDRSPRPTDGLRHA